MTRRRRAFRINKHHNDVASPRRSLITSRNANRALQARAVKAALDIKRSFYESRPPSLHDQGKAVLLPLKRMKLFFPSYWVRDSSPMFMQLNHLEYDPLLTNTQQWVMRRWQVDFIWKKLKSIVKQKRIGMHWNTLRATFLMIIGQKNILKL